MGIQNLFKLIKGSEFDASILRNKKVGIDASYEIYRLFLSMKDNKQLTDSEGKSTVILHQLMNRLIYFKKENIDVLFVFDNPVCNVLKLEETKKRNDTRQKNIDRHILEEKSIEYVSFKLTADIITEVQYILKMLGITYCTAYENIEAEKLGAHLVKTGIIDYFISNDSDTLVFGSPNIIRNHTENGRKLNSIYELKSILTDLNVTYEDFVKISIILGCDFCKKTPRVGLKTVLKKYKDIILTLEQKNAYNYFIEECVYDNSSFIKSKSDIPKFIEYLENRGFNRNDYILKLSIFN